MAHESVTGLVERDDPLLLVGYQPALALRTGDDTLDGFLELLLVYALLAMACCEQRRLVDHVGQIGAGEAGSPASEHAQVDLVGQRLALHVNLQDALAALEVGTVHHYLAVETTGAQECRVEDVGTVGRRDQDDVVLEVEAVHLDEQLVQGLFAFVMTSTEPCPALTAHRIDLVHEDYAGGSCLGLLEQVAHAGGAHADEHLDEVGAGYGEERHGRLSGHRTGQQRLACARRADKQHALGDLRTQRLELARVGQKLLYLLEFLDGLVSTGHVLERDPRLVAGHAFHPRLAERHDLAVAALHLVEEEQHEDHEYDDGGDLDEYRPEGQPRLRIHRIFDVGMLRHQLVEGVLAHEGGLELGSRFLALLLGLVVLIVLALDDAIARFGGDLDHPAVLQALDELRGAQLVDGLRRADELDSQVEKDPQYEEIEDDGPQVPVLHDVQRLLTRCSTLYGRSVSVLLRLEDTDIWQIPVSFRIVEPVTDHELVGHVESDVLTVDRYPLFALFAQKGHYLQRPGIAGRQVLEKVLECQSRVEYVFDHEHVTVLYRVVEVLDDADHAGGFGGRPVTGDRHEIDLHRRGYVARKVSEEEGSAAQDRDEQDTLVPVVCAYPRTELGHAVRYLLFSEDDALQVRMHPPSFPGSQPTCTPCSSVDVPACGRRPRRPRQTHGVGRLISDLVLVGHAHARDPYYILPVSDHGRGHP